MIETEKQRRWWFATHPEFSSDHTEGAAGDHNEQRPEKVRPEDVDAYVDEALKYESGPVADFLKSVKRNFGTGGETSESVIGNKEASGSQEGSENRFSYDQGLKDGRESALDPNRAPKPPLVMNADYVSGFYQGVDDAQREYKKGWDSGYWSIHGGKAPPDLDPQDNSAYAQGVRGGATAALDEREQWEQIWQDPIPFSLGNRHSRNLRKDMEKAGEPRQSPDEDAHHIVPWRHWRAQAARDVLEKYGINIDSAENGAWVDRPYHWTLNNSSRYMETVTEMLRPAGSREEALQILAKMKDLLSRGKFPLGGVKP